MEVQRFKTYEDSLLLNSCKIDQTQLLNSMTESIFYSPEKIDETQLLNSMTESIYHSPSPKKEVTMQRIGDSSPISNRTANSSSYELSSSSSSSPTNSSSNSGINLLIKAIFRDDKSSLISQATTSKTINRETLSRLLHICCEFDSVNSANALLNGEVSGVIPLINEVDVTTGYAPLHTAAENHSTKCIELIIKKRGRTDIKTRKIKISKTSFGKSSSGDGETSCDSTITTAGAGNSSRLLQCMLPLELALRCVRMDIKWGPDHPLDDLLLILSEKDLGAVSVLAEKTRQTAEVAYAIAMEGRVAALAALLMVATDKVIGSVLEIRNNSGYKAEKTTVYSCVIKEAISIFSLRQNKQKGVEEIDQNVYRGISAKERRVLLLREIELLHFFGASHTNNSCVGKKVASPLVLACQAGDKEVMNLLLKTPIDVNEVDAEGNSALHWCLKASSVLNSDKIRILLLLLNHGARVRQKDKVGQTSVHIAAGNGNVEALEILLSRDPDSVHLKSELKETPLFLAAKNEHIESAELLLHFGARTEIHNLRRERPIELAKSQQMRSALNRTSVVITNRDSQQKYTVRNDVVVSTREVLPRETASSSDSVNSNSDGDICKYFTSASGCIRGSECYYKHGEGELCDKKNRSKLARALALEEFKRKVFVGGLPVTIDSESLACIIEEKFGPVAEAKVLEMEIDGQVLSRGFGFVTFKDDKSVTAALEAHYTDVWGKKAEIKTAVPKWLLSLDDSDVESPREKSPKESIPVQETIQPKPRQLHSQEFSQTDKPEQTSWASRIAEAQTEQSQDERKVPHKKHMKDMPKWFHVLKKWLPNFLRKMSKNAQDGEYYSLSSLKTDFKALFSLVLDHASLGYLKLSEFIKDEPGLCSVKFINTGGLVPNHMILLPPKIYHPPPLIVSKTDFPTLAKKESDKDTDLAKKQADKDADLEKKESDKDTVSSSSSVTNPDAGVTNTVVAEAVQNVKPSFTDTLPAINPRFLQFLAPDPIFLARSWRGNGGFRAPEEHFRLRHLILEYLAQKKKEVFFLRSIKFYDSYAECIKRGTCFGCGDNRLVWANYPCQHLLWCSDCKFNVSRIAEVGTLSHKCVVCDDMVEKIDLIRWSKMQYQSYDDLEFPSIHAASLMRSQKLRA